MQEPVLAFLAGDAGGAVAAVEARHLHEPLQSTKQMPVRHILGAAQLPKDQPVIGAFLPVLL